jgi:hypothetical protein
VLVVLETVDVKTLDLTIVVHHLIQDRASGEDVTYRIGQSLLQTLTDTIACLRTNVETHIVGNSMTSQAHINAWMQTITSHFVPIEKMMDDSSN